MPLRLLRPSGVALIFCATVFAGCSGSGTSSRVVPTTSTPTPVPSGSPSATPTPAPSGTPSATPTPAPSGSPSPTPAPGPNYVFSNTATQATFNSTGGAISTGPYSGVTLATTWGANNATGSFAFTANLATGNGDITPAGFTTNTTGHLVTYVEFTATPIVTFAQTPNLTFTVVSPASFGGTTCYIYSLNGLGSSTPTWRQGIGPATPSGSTVTFPPVTLPPPSTVNIGDPSNGNQTYLSLNCQ